MARAKPRPKSKAKPLRSPPAVIVSRGGGQPTKYDPSYCARLIEHGRNGRSFETFAVEIGVHRDTVNEWTRKHPEFSDAVDQARALRIQLFEDASRNIAMGIVPKAPTDENGAPVGLMTRGSATMAMFLLRNLDPTRYRREFDDALPPPDPMKDAVVNFNYEIITAPAPLSPTPSGDDASNVSEVSTNAGVIPGLPTRTTRGRG